MADTVTGGCLCGGVRYEVTLPVPYAGQCHCSRCRRWGGGAHTSHMLMLREQFQLTRGQELLVTYRTAGKAPRVFCSVCGSSLFTRSLDDPEEDSMVVHMGSLDGDPGVRPMLHELAAFKAPWHTITDELPQMTDIP